MIYTEQDINNKILITEKIDTANLILQQYNIQNITVCILNEVMQEILVYM